MKNCEPGLGEGVKVAPGFAIAEMPIVASKQLHGEDSEHGNDYEEEGEQAEHGSPGRQQGEDYCATPLFAAAQSPDVSAGGKGKRINQIFCLYLFMWRCRWMSRVYLQSLK